MQAIVFAYPDNPQETPATLYIVRLAWHPRTEHTVRLSQDSASIKVALAIGGVLCSQTSKRRDDPMCSALGTNRPGRRTPEHIVESALDKRISSESQVLLDKQLP
jgi:hypothetical protein